MTTVYYGYDAQGNLTWVSQPENNGNAQRRLKSYGYQTLGTGSVMAWAASPRYNAGCNAGGCGTDGGLLEFTFAGSTPASSTLSHIWHFAVVNPAPADGTGTPLQAGYATTAFWYLGEYYTTGVSTPTYGDTDGHYTNWIVDGLGRPTQTQECAQTAGPGAPSQCSGTPLSTNETWDADNNLVAETDARGNETDYAYDAHGNTVAVGMPRPAPGAARPTKLFTYDAHDNLTAYCDPIASDTLGSDWTTPPTAPIPGQGGLCPQTLVATVYEWPATTNEQFGELSAVTAPAPAAGQMGYRRTFSYDPGPQGGVDYGLPTGVQGAPIAQSIDSTTPTRQPQQTFWYDGNGNLVCYGTGSGQWLLTYDGLGRVTSTADPDDASSGTGICGKTGAQAGWNTTTRTSYFPDGNISSKQTASQVANGIATTFTYDLDGNQKSETHHYGCMTVSGCNAGVTNKWYDGDDRLVEVQQPYDSGDIQAYPWSTRYIYDLSGNGVTPYRGIGLRGYGNLVSTQELLTGAVWAPTPGQTYGITTGTWMDVRASSFDALDRPISSYEAAFGDQPKATNTYDGPASLGLLATVALATGELKSYAYDGLGRTLATTYPNDPSASVTPRVDVAYDIGGRVTSRATASLGTQTMTYDNTGAIRSITEPASLGGGTIGYDYYADGTRSDVTYVGAPYQLSTVAQYAYRPDGKPETLQLSNSARFTWSYTSAGRPTSQSDPYTGTTIQPTATRTNPNGRLVPIYPFSLTFVPRSTTYDTYGRIASLVLPETFSYSVPVPQYDLEDGVGQETRNLYVSGQTPSSQSVCAATNVRREQYPIVTSNCSPWPSMPLDLNGTMLNAGSGPPGSNGGAWTVDARSGMKLTNRLTAAPGIVTGSQYVYDSSGRMSQDSEATYNACPAGYLYSPLLSPTCYRYGTRTKTYDGENRLRSDTYPYADPTRPTQTSYGTSYGDFWMDDNAGSYQPPNLTVDYDASSHPTRISEYHPDWPSTQVLAWLWDGNDRFLQCQLVNNQCTQLTFSLGGLADYDPQAGQATVYDRNASGLVVISHSSADFSSWTEAKAPGPIIAPHAGLGTCSTGDASDPGSCAKLRTGKLTNDGWTIDNDTWQGVRTMDQSVGQWNTPDAYAGEVHDPMSQKPFMWNRNNPYEYSDPSGYCVGPLAIVCAWALANAPEISVASAALAEAAGGGGLGPGVWARGWATRGIVIESALGKNTASAFPVIDRYVLGQGAGAASVTSIKSMNLGSASYQSASRITSTIKQYVDKLANFKGATHGGTEILVDKSTLKVLEVVIPNQSLTAAQEQGLQEAAAYAASQKVQLHVVRW